MPHMLSTSISKLLKKRHLKTCLSLNKKHWRIFWGESQENEPLAGMLKDKMSNRSRKETREETGKRHYATGLGKTVFDGAQMAVSL